MAKLEDLREWLTDRIDGSEETRGEDSLISHFINQIDALDDQVRSLTQPKTIAEWQAAKAPPSATAAPVAWCVGYDDPRMGRIHSDPTMHKPQAEALAERNGLALVSLYAGSPPVREGGAPIAKESA